jgi:hypothetical protein
MMTDVSFKIAEALLVTGFLLSFYKWCMMIERKIGMLGNPAGNGVSFLFPR